MRSLKLAVALDCDGVILDSNQMKTAAFAEVLRGYPADAVQQFLDFQRRSFGLSRYRLLDRFFSDFCKMEASSGEVDGLLARFGEVCSEEYLKVPLTHGAETALAELAQRWPLYVCSGSDQQELRRVFQRRGLDRYFQGVFGSPTEKAELVSHVMAQEQGGRLVFVGDASADWEAARKNEVPFVFMARYSNERAALAPRAESAGVPILEDLQGLPALLQAAYMEVD